MSAFTVCWKEEGRIAAIHFHSLILANALEHCGVREISVASEMIHQQGSNEIFFPLRYLSCQKKASSAQGVQNRIDHTFRQPNLRLNSFCF